MAIRGEIAAQIRCIYASIPRTLCLANAKVPNTIINYMELLDTWEGGGGVILAELRVQTLDVVIFNKKLLKYLKLNRFSFIGFSILDKHRCSCE